MQDDTTIRTYDQYAKTYDQGVVEFWKNFPMEFIDKFARDLSGKRVLDLGSGSGRDALLLREHGFDIVCVDASQSMVDITEKLGFESYKSQFSSIDFPADSFDGIWAYTSLIHVPKKEAEMAIRKLYPIIKPKGLFAVGVIQGEGEATVEHETMPGAHRYFKYYTAEELRHLVEPLGFSYLYEQTYQPHNSIYLSHVYRKTGGGFGS